MIVASALWIVLLYFASSPGECFVPKRSFGALLDATELEWRSSITHKDMTSKAMLLVAKAALLDNPNPKYPGSTETINKIDEDSLTSSSLLTAYYGENDRTLARNQRRRHYEAAIKSVNQANAATDTNRRLGKLSSAHFDNEQFAASQARLINIRSQVTSLITEENYAEARRQAGGLLHTLQDFYSHSNWVEMGNTGTYDVLGIPGKTDIPNVVPPNVPTCRDCKKASGILVSILRKFFRVTTYECDETLLSKINNQKLLTSGYYKGQVDENGNEIPKIESYMKCSHGGFLDGSRDTPARGGINKDSRASLWSYYTDKSLHTRAADLATKATVDIMNDIRTDVSDDIKFLKFLGITTSTVTSIAYVIDTTGSMGDELPEIQAGIPEIRTRLQSYAASFGGDATVNYILVPFNDPDPGTTFITQDAEEFLTAIGNLFAFGGGDCPEPSLGALIRAIKASEPESPIYIFTDAPASDEYRLPEVEALAMSNMNTYTSVLTSGCFDRKRKRSKGNEHGLHRRQATGLELYNYLAMLSGGQVLNVQAADISELSSLISQSSQVLRSTIFFKLGSSSVSQVLTIPVDVTMNELLISIVGVNLTVQVHTPKGLLTTPVMGSEITLQTSTTFIAVLNVSSQAAGDSWNITLTSFGQYSVEVSALSSFSFQQYLYVVDTTNPVPDITTFEGRPTAGVPIVFNIVVIGSIEEVAEFSSVAVLDSSSGDVLDTVNITETEGDFFGVFLPPQMQTFQLQLLGKDTAGNTISRIGSVTSETTSIDLQLGERVPPLIVLMPGETTEVDVFLYNMGESSIFDLSITSNNDEFSVTITPSQLTLATNDTGNATVTIAVPLESNAGETVTISIVASSTTDERTDFTSLEVLTSTTPPVNVTNVYPKVNTSEFFQLKLQLPGNVECEDWLRNDRISGITAEFLAIIGTLCSCEFTEDNIDVSEISCKSGSDAVLIRGTISYVTSGDTYSAIELRSLLSDWVQNGTRTLTVDGTVLSVNSTCPVPLESLQDTTCLVTQPTIPTETIAVWVWVVVGAVAAVLLVTLLIFICAVLVIIVK